MRSARLGAAIAAVVAAGCARAPTLPEREPFADAPPSTASADELRRIIGSDAVASVRGKLDLGLREGADGRYRTCRGALAAANPWSGRSPGIYLKGWLEPAPALFTMVSDGSSFWLHVPRDRVVYTGPVARRRGADGAHDVRLDARDLFRALFVEPVGPHDEVEVEEAPESYLVSVLRGGRPVRRIRVDRRGLVVRRETFLDAAGRPEVSVDRERYVEREGRLYPARIVIADATGNSVRLEFESFALDPADLDRTAFRRPAPRGVRTERVPGEGEHL